MYRPYYVNVVSVPTVEGASDSADDLELVTTEDFSVSCGCSSNVEDNEGETDIGHLVAPFPTVSIYGVSIIATAIGFVGI